MLWNFLPRYNQRFGVTPSQLGSAYRQLPPGVCLDSVLCFKYLRTVANDNTVRFNGATIQILPDGYRDSYARAKVEIQERLDGSIVVAYRGRTLAAEPGPHGAVDIRARTGRRANGHVTSNGASTHHVQKAYPRAPTKIKTRSPRRPAPITRGGDGY